MRIENIQIQNTPKAEGQASRDIDGFAGILEGLIFAEDKEAKEGVISLDKGEEVDNLIVEDNEKEDPDEFLGFFYPGGIEIKPRQLELDSEEIQVVRLQDIPPRGIGLGGSIILDEEQRSALESSSLEALSLEEAGLEPVDLKPLNLDVSEKKLIDFDQVFQQERVIPIEEVDTSKESPIGNIEENLNTTMDKAKPKDLGKDPGIAGEISKKAIEEVKLQDPKIEVDISRDISKKQVEEGTPKDSDIERNLEWDYLKPKNISVEKTVAIPNQGAESKEVQMAKEDLISSLEKTKEKPKDSRFENILINSASSRVKNPWIDKPLPADLEDLGLENIHRLADRIIDSIKVTNLDTASLLEVQLYPEELGAVNIKLKLEDGKIIGKILVENQLTKSLLVNSLSQLNQNLAKENINLEKLEIDINTGLNGSLAEKNFSENQGQRDFNQGLRSVFRKDSIKAMGITSSGLVIDQGFGSNGVNILV